MFTVIYVTRLIFQNFLHTIAEDWSYSEVWSRYKKKEKRNNNIAAVGLKMSLCFALSACTLKCKEEGKTVENGRFGKWF